MEQANKIGKQVGSVRDQQLAIQFYPIASETIKLLWIN